MSSSYLARLAVEAYFSDELGVGTPLLSKANSCSKEVLIRTKPHMGHKKLRTGGAMPLAHCKFVI
ncbi:hypothetical protein Dimus_037487, partial [Dionaea muscipula]